MHRIIEGHGKLESLHILGGLDPLMLHVQSDRLAVDIFHGRHQEGS